MEDLPAEVCWNNEKSCQTDEACPEAHGACQKPVCGIEPGDPPLLQRQLHTSKSGIHQIIECFRTGTTQLKHILLKEVDTIFECKLCRSLFRGLPNLITHKEFYCSPRLPEHEEHLGSEKQSLAVKDLLEALYPRPESRQHVIRLEQIETNQNAVFQHVIKEDSAGLPSDGRGSAHGSAHSADGWKQSRAEEKGGEGPREDGESEEEEREEEEREEGQSEEQAEEAGGGGGADPSEDEEEDEEDSEEEEEEEDEEDEEEMEMGGGGVSDVVITCCLCGKDFSTRRGVRRHCRKMHQRRLDELRRFTETRTVPISLLSVVKDRHTGQVHLPSPDGKCCPVCFKTFATKANVRRHFDEVHRGLRRDLITPDIATKPGQLESASPRRGPAPAHVTPKAATPLPQYNLAACKCLICQRSYSSQARLKRHLRFVHKILTVRRPRVAKRPREEQEEREEGEEEEKERGGARKSEENSPTLRRPKLALGFDFKQLFCKLCKRQFSSRQNLAKHIELHTDNGSDIFIKFYRCPLCRYESRRKRDVLRHVTVVHKKNTAYLAKILPALETRAVKKPAEVVLGGAGKRRHPRGEELNGQHKADAPQPAPARRNDLAPPSPPVTRKQSLFPRGGRCPNGPALHEEAQDSTEVRVTKNFSLHACDMCGRAFAKKVYLESHKRSHRNAAHSESRTAGVSTRSKSLLW